MTLMTAHKELEDLTFVREVAHFKPLIEQQLSNIIYNALWFNPLTDALIAFLKETQLSKGVNQKTVCILKTWLLTLLLIPLIKMQQLASLNCGGYQVKSMQKCKHNSK